MKSWIRLVVVLAGMLICAGMAQAAVSINITDGGGGYPDGHMVANDLAGPVARISNWNNFVEADLTWVGSPLQATMTGMGDADGTTSYPSMSMTLAFFGGSSGRIDDDGNQAAGNEDNLFSGRFDNWHPSAGVNTITLGDIPFATYDLYMLVRDDGVDRAGYFEVDGTTYYIRTGLGNPDENGDGYVLSSDTDLGSTNKADVAQGNYVRFAGLTNPTAVINMQSVALLDGDFPYPRLKVSGLQVLPHPDGTVTDLTVSGTTAGLLAGDTDGAQVSVFAETTGQSGYVTVLAGTSYTSTDPSVFTVSATGMISPELPGTADLVVDYGGASVTQAVEVLGSVDLRLVVPDVYTGTDAQAGLEADFATVSNVDVTAFNYVTFSGGPASVVTVAPDGTITPAGEGSFSMTGMYAGATAILDPAGEVATLELANSFGVCLSPNLNAGNDSFMEPGDLAGALVRVGNWNNWVQSELTAAGGFYTLDEIVGDNGQPIEGTTVSIDPSDPILHRTSGANINESTLYSGVEDIRNDGATVVVVTNMPYGNYDFYAYMRSDNAIRGGAFTIDGHTIYLRGGLGEPNDDGSNYIISEDTSFGLGTDVDQGNCVLFRGLTNETLVMSIETPNMGDGTRRCKWVGFQAVRNYSGTATNLYLVGDVPELKAGDPAGHQLSVFVDTMEGDNFNVTTHSNTMYSTTDPSVLTVSADGVIQPQLPGTADVVVSFQSLTVTQENVVVVGPTAVRLSIDPADLWVGAQGGADFPVQAQLEADFASVSNVDVTAWNQVVFSGTPPSVVDVTAGGLVTAVGPGTYSLSGTYAGLTDTLTSVGTVTVFYAPKLDSTGGTALNINMGSLGRPIAFRELAGAPGVRSANWNDLLVSGDQGALTNLLDSSGIEQTGAIAQFQGDSANGSVNTYSDPTLTSNDTYMVSTAFDQQETPGSLIVSGIPYAKYDVYCYVWNGAETDRPGYFAIGGVTNWVRNVESNGWPTATGENYNEGTTQGLPTSIANIVQGNYVKFTSLSTPDLLIGFQAAGDDVIPDADPVERMKIAGFQIVNTDTGPKISNIALQGADLLVTWASSAGEVFDVSEATMLDPDDWTNVLADLAATPPENSYTSAAPLGVVGFVRVERQVQGPLLDEDFESGATGWTTFTGSGSDWELGSPTNVGPASAHSPVNCYGTDLDANHAPYCETYLRSPVVDLTGVTAATLTFWQYIDSEGDGYDFGEVRIIEADTTNVLDTVHTSQGNVALWEPVSVPMPAAATGQPVRVEFYFESDEVFEWTGWYIDDVSVTRD